MKAFEVKVKYEKMMEDGTNKIVSEFYLVDALSFTEAEATATEEMSILAGGEFEIASFIVINISLLMIQNIHDRCFLNLNEYIVNHCSAHSFYHSCLCAL